MAKKKVVIVVTSVEKYPEMDRATGLWLGEAVHFYKKMKDAGFAIDFVSPRGGYTPLDPVSLQSGMLPVDWQCYADATFREKLATTLTPGNINAADYDVIYYTGGHGVLWDYPDNRQLQEISRAIYEIGGIVSSVCHGAAGLFNIRLSNGDLLIKDKIVTGFSNAEETEIGLADHVPYLTQNELVKRGARYVQAEKTFISFAVADGLLPGKTRSRVEK
jgi:putative intracellular protease/amidase